MKLIPLGILICLATQGCVGVGALRTKTEVFENPKICDSAGARNVMQGGATNETTYTADWLEAHWGKPRSVGQAPPENRGQLSTYKFGLLWNGIVPVVGVPIPLVLPVGREKVVFVLRDGQVVSAKRVRARSFTALAGLIFGPCGASWGTAVDSE